MAVVIARQKMTVRHSEGEHTIFPSRDPQSLPDHLLGHPHVEGAIKSGWIVLTTPTFEYDWALLDRIFGSEMVNIPPIDISKLTLEVTEEIEEEVNSQIAALLAPKTKKKKA